MNNYKPLKFQKDSENRQLSIPFVFLIVTGRCNSRCITCSYWRNRPKKEILTKERIYSLISTLNKYHLETIIFTGGEPLLRSDLIEIAQKLKKGFSHLTLRLLTNGILLEKYADVISKIFDVVAVSFDSANRETYKKIRGVDALQKITNGINRLRMLNRETEIRLRTVIQKENFREIPQIISLGRELGANKISFIPADMFSDISFGRSKEMQNQNKVILSLEELVEYKDLLKSILETQKQNLKSGFLVEEGYDLIRIYDYYASFHGLKKPVYPKCNSGWTAIIVDFQGDVWPCFFYKSIGNIAKVSLEEILHSDKMVDFKSKIIDHRFKYCQKCTCPFFYEK